MDFDFDLDLTEAVKNININNVKKAIKKLKEPNSNSNSYYSNYPNKRFSKPKNKNNKTNKNTKLNEIIRLHHLDKALYTLINRIDEYYAFYYHDFTYVYYVARFNINSIIKIIELLIKAGANPNIQNNHGDTILIIMIKYDWILKNNNCIEIIHLLFQSGANPNIQDKQGNTALYYLSKSYTQKYIQCTKLLLKYNANPNCYGIYIRVMYCGLVRNMRILLKAGMIIKKNPLQNCYWYYNKITKITNRMKIVHLLNDY